MHKMSDSGDADCVPGSSGLSSGAALSFPSGRGLPGRARGLSSPPPPGRLTSLRSRDLTLGAFKKSKKTFEPNVKAVRKSKDEFREEIHVAPKERRQWEERKRESRGRRRERPQTIQSHSIFEQGPADSIRKTAWRGATDVCGSTAPPLCKSVKERRESEDEDQILRKLQRDDFIDDPGLRNDAKLRPIQLPLCRSSSFLRTEALTTSTCKEDAPLFRTPCCVPPGSGVLSPVEQPKPEQPSLLQLFQDLKLSGGEELFFIQLPDCMPGRPSAKAQSGVGPTTEKPGKKDGKAEDKRAAVVECVVKEDCPVLSDFPEGFLGKLQIRRSGKVELKLGDIVLDVSEGAAFSFLQQLVSVRLSDGRSGDMMVLGNVQHKLVLSPDFQALLREAPTKPPQGHR